MNNNGVLDSDPLYRKFGDALLDRRPMESFLTVRATEIAEILGRTLKFTNGEQFVRPGSDHPDQLQLTIGDIYLRVEDGTFRGMTRAMHRSDFFKNYQPA